MNLFQNLKRNQSGSVVSGFSLVFPLVPVLTLIIVQFIFLTINYATISLAVDNSSRLARIGYSDNQIIFQTNNYFKNFNLLIDQPEVYIENINLQKNNLKIIKVEVNYKFLGFKAFTINSKSYAF